MAIWPNTVLAAWAAGAFPADPVKNSAPYHCQIKIGSDFNEPSHSGNNSPPCPGEILRSAYLGAHGVPEAGLAALASQPRSDRFISESTPENGNSFTGGT
jgi:hypothetical protein